MAEQVPSLTGLGPRIITGFALAGLLFVVWLTGGLPMFVVVTIAAAIAQWEFCSLFLSGGRRLDQVLAVILGTGMLFTAFMYPSWPAHLSLIVAVLIVCLRFLVCWGRAVAEDRLHRSAVLLASIAYVPLLLCPVFGFSQVEQLLIVMVPALSDIAAFFVGSRWGRRRIWPSVSPKKSVEGAAAGLAAALVTCCVIGLVAGIAPVGCFVLLGLVLGVAAPLGDFFESALKRAVSVKDSGILLPGHGGMLDRLDSILFVTAVYAVASRLCVFF